MPGKVDLRPFSTSFCVTALVELALFALLAAAWTYLSEFADRSFFVFALFFALALPSALAGFVNCARLRGTKVGAAVPTWAKGHALLEAFALALVATGLAFLFAYHLGNPPLDLASARALELLIFVGLGLGLAEIASLVVFVALWRAARSNDRN